MGAVYLERSLVSLGTGPNLKDCESSLWFIHNLCLTCSLLSEKKLFFVGICKVHPWKAQFLLSYLSWKIWRSCEYFLLLKIFLKCYILIAFHTGYGMYFFSLMKHLLCIRRISDLKTQTMTFPDLKDLKRMIRLWVENFSMYAIYEELYDLFRLLSTGSSLYFRELRNCLITGPIPDYIGEMESLKTL